MIELMLFKKENSVFVIELLPLYSNNVSNWGVM